MTPSPIEQALLQAQQAIWLSNPNPRVGCVITGAGGELLGQGHTQHAGGPHAEVMALRNAAERKLDVRGATAWVTLEPCSHHGRTGPCCDALIEAGIGRVVSSLADPNPLVAGKGFARLRAAGIDVEVGPGATESRELNIGFFSRMIRKTPWVRLKAAQSLDGKTALDNGSSQWITGIAARADGHAWRARACAILTGIGTVLEDDPQLDVRLVEAPRQPHLVLVDSRLETPLDARVFGPQRQIFIYTASTDAARRTALEARGVHVIHMPGRAGTDGAKVDLGLMLHDLALREVNEVHVEAGHKLNGSLVRAGLVDEFILYVAPKLLGQGRELAQFGPLTHLSQAIDLNFLNTQAVGPDLLIQARVAGRSF